MTRPISELARRLNGMEMRGPGGIVPVGVFRGDEIAQLRDTVFQTIERIKSNNEIVRSSIASISAAEKLSAVGCLSASIAHEINNPLSTISLYIQLILSRRTFNDETERQLQTILGEIHRINEELNGLLDYSRKRKSMIVPVDVRNTAEEILELVGPEAYGKNVRLRNGVPAALPMVMADPAGLKQVFLNLVLNAIQAMPQGGEVALGAFTATPGEISTLFPDVSPVEAPRLVVITVKDSGIGIPPENIDKVFKQFFTTKTDGKGTGLGLMVCKYIIEEIGGEITVETSQGASFHIILRAAEE